MPALTAQPVVIVWKMPIVPALSGRGFSGLHGEDARKVATEALQAIRRFQGTVGHQSIDGPMRDNGILDPLASHAAMREFANQQGVDLDALVAGAARNFLNPVIERRRQPLTAEELELLFDDDQRAFNR